MTTLSPHRLVTLRYALGRLPGDRDHVYWSCSCSATGNGSADPQWSASPARREDKLRSIAKRGHQSHRKRAEKRSAS